MAKILLCNPLFLSQNQAEQALKSPYFPIGLLYLASYLRENQHQVAIFDGTFQADESSFEERLQTEKPDLVGITAVRPNKEAALTLAKIAHEAGYPVIVGGPDPTQFPEAYLAYPQIDLVVHHEGEETLLRLLDHFDASRLLEGDQLSSQVLSQELGVAYRNENGDLVLNPPRPYIEDLDDLPLPARDLIDMEQYLELWRDENGYTSLTIATTRGCPYGCEWCQDAVHGPLMRQRSPESVAAEVKELKEIYQIDRLRLVDDVDGLSRDWFEAWAEAAQTMDAVIPFEALNELERQDLPMLDIRDSL